MFKRIITGVLLLFLCGCIKTKDELTLNADGSGRVRIETHSKVPPELSTTMESGMMGLGQAAIYPPFTEAQAHRFFPGKDFTVTFKQEKGTNDETVTVVEAAFKNVNALLASPYGRAHQLTLTQSNGVLTVKAVSGLEGLARLSQVKDDSGLGMTALPGLAALEKSKNQMRSEFRITLPHPISASNGTNEGKSVVWVADRQKTKTADAFARELGQVLHARCSAHGLTFVPVTPTRLALLPFDDLSAGAATGNATVPSTNQVLAVAKFIPYGLRVTRSVDLSGEGGMQQNQAQLVGAVVLPRKLAPQRWGQGTLDEAVDAKGNDLKPSNAGGNSYDYMSGMDSVNGDENGETAASDTLRHVVTLTFRPPDWSVKKIARIEGGLKLYYYGNPEVIKLTNAIPADWIADMSQMMSGGFSGKGKQLTDAKLSALGLTLSMPMAMIQNGVTLLTFQTGGKQAAISDFQVFDANGKPWPTMYREESGGGNPMCMVLVPGKPKPPLSLALLASGGGTTVEVPISMRNVPITQNQSN